MEHLADQRSIRSFVRRQGRLSSRQQHEIEAGMPRWGIKYAPECVNLDLVFGRAAPKILEIGFGMGGATAAIAVANPGQDYLAVDVHSPGVGNLCKLIAENGLSNVRIIHHDAVEVLDYMLASASLDGVHIFFPDPWPKKRHNKRRLIQPALVEKLVVKLKPGGYLHAATDWHSYALQMMEVFSGERHLFNTSDGYSSRPDGRPLTKFEARGIKLGHRVWDIIFRRC